MCGKNRSYFLRLPKLCNLRGNPFERAESRGSGVRRLARAPFVRVGTRSDVCRPVPEDVQRVSSPTEAGQLLDRSGIGKPAIGESRQQLDHR